MGTMIDKHEDDSDRVRFLLRLAGPREVVPPERTLRVRTAVRDEWRRQTRARSRRLTVGRSLGALAAAALVLIGVRVAVRDARPVDGPGLSVATVEAVSGAVPFRPGESIRAGSAVDTTAGGRIALRLLGGIAVRVDSRTQLQLVSNTTLTLDHGAIYVDSGDSGKASSLEVRTRLGVARDIGTRFEVRIDAEVLRVRVREGVVRLTQERQSHDATAGDEVTLDNSGGVVRRTVPLDGAAWAWTAPFPRPFEIEGRFLREFLDWICEENGWQLRFADAAAERKAATVVLHGSIKGLTPEEMLAAVLATSDAEHKLEKGVLLVRLTSTRTKN